jgi:hypothetical protein
MEDEIHAAGHGDAFAAAVDAFEAGRRTRADQSALYDQLIGWGASPEQADDYVDLLMQD